MKKINNVTFRNGKKWQFYSVKFLNSRNDINKGDVVLGYEHYFPGCFSGNDRYSCSIKGKYDYSGKISLRDLKVESTSQKHGGSHTKTMVQAKWVFDIKSPQKLVLVSGIVSGYYDNDEDLPKEFYSDGHWKDNNGKDDNQRKTKKDVIPPPKMNPIPRKHKIVSITSKTEKGWMKLKQCLCSKRFQQNSEGWRKIQMSCNGPKWKQSLMNSIFQNSTHMKENKKLWMIIHTASDRARKEKNENQALRIICDCFRRATPDVGNNSQQWSGIKQSSEAILKEI